MCPPTTPRIRKRLVDPNTYELRLRGGDEEQQEAVFMPQGHSNFEQHMQDLHRYLGVLREELQGLHQQRLNRLLAKIFIRGACGLFALGVGYGLWRRFGR